VFSIYYPIIKLVSPQDGETLSGVITLKWYAIDSSDTSLDIYLYYTNDKIVWSRLNGVLHNNVDLHSGEYQLDTTMFSDGEYIFKIEAVNNYNALSFDDSGTFTIFNGYQGVKIVQVIITDKTISSTKWVKNGDRVEISTDLTGGQGLKKEDIYADLSGFGKNTHVIPDSYNGQTARWFITNVKCDTNKGEISILISINLGDSKTGKINVDNDKPEVVFVEPINGLYIFNRKLLPISRIIILGPVNYKTKVDDLISGVDYVEFYIDDELENICTENPFEWYMHKRLRGEHTISVKVYDYAGNMNSAQIIPKFFSFI